MPSYRAVLARKWVAFICIAPSHRIIGSVRLSLCQGSNVLACPGPDWRKKKNRQLSMYHDIFVHLFPVFGTCQNWMFFKGNFNWRRSLYRVLLIPGTAPKRPIACHSHIWIYSFMLKCMPSLWNELYRGSDDALISNPDHVDQSFTTFYLVAFASFSQSINNLSVGSEYRKKKSAAD